LFLVAGQPHELGHAHSGPHVQLGPQQHSPAFGGTFPLQAQFPFGHALHAQVFVVGWVMVFISFAREDARAGRIITGAEHFMATSDAVNA
jgi:hypothetical protein